MRWRAKELGDPLKGGGGRRGEGRRIGKGERIIRGEWINSNLASPEPMREGRRQQIERIAATRSPKSMAHLNGRADDSMPGKLFSHPEAGNHALQPPSSRISSLCSPHTANLSCVSVMCSIAVKKHSIVPTTIFRAIIIVPLREFSWDKKVIMSLGILGYMDWHDVLYRTLY